MSDDAEHALAGGTRSSPRRVPEGVHRRPYPSNPLAHDALRFFESAGWDGAPRLLDVGPDGAETLTFVPGRVPWQYPLPDWAVSDPSLVAIARLVRAFHDLTADTELAGDGEVLCHNDLAPNNTVYREPPGGLPYAFIDWDVAGPGRRIEDLAHVCWQWLELGPGVADVPEAARRVELIAAAYGLVEPAELVPTVIWWQERCARGIDVGAGAGDPALQRMVAAGVPDRIRLERAWTERHAPDLAPPRARRPSHGS